jgi:hypothetical protein
MMAYRKWDVEIDGRSHIVELETKAMGHRIIRVDGIQQVDEKKLISLGTTDEIQVNTLVAQVSIQGGNYELFFPEAGSESTAPFSVSAPQTERITLEKDPAGFAMVVDTRKGAGYFLILVGLVMVGFGGWLLLNVRNVSENLVIFLVDVVIILAGIYMIYSSLKMALNRVFYRVARHELNVRQGPIPWPGNRILDPKSLDGLQIKTISRRSSSKSAVRTYTYRVHVKSKNSERMTAIGEFTVADDANFVADQIGKYLDLPTPWDLPIESNFHPGPPGS